MDKHKKLRLIINIVLIILFAGLIIYIGVRYAPSITDLVRKPDKLRELLNSYGYVSALVFIALQVLQVVVAAIPGELVQIAGGYVYGTFLGTLYSIAGILIGTIIVFYISRLLGYTLVRTFVPQKKIEKFNFIINNPKSEITMFILFLIPGIPKDILTYIAGLTPVKPLKFFIIITVARLPALIVSSFIGTNIEQRDYLVVIIISVIAIILFAAGVLLKDRIIKKVHDLIHKEKTDE